MRKLTDFVLAHKRSVAVFWIVLTIAGMFGASRVTDQLDDQFSMPSSEAFATNQEIEERFSSGGIVEPLVAVVELPAGVSAEDPAVRSDLRVLEGRLSDALPARGSPRTARPVTTRSSPTTDKRPTRSCIRRSKTSPIQAPPRSTRR